MESGNIVRIYVEAETIDDCVNSLRQKVSVTIDGINAKARRTQVTGIVQSMELGEGPLPTHQTRVTLLLPPE
jgi:hypothetical protein